jgi:chaperonin cofactor prefoldin
LTVVFNVTGNDPFPQILTKLDQLLKEVHKMALDQATFDTELADLVTAINALIAAVDAIPPADLTAEGQTVSDAAAAVKAELDKIAPPTAP